jgi:hypothetical protein
MKIKGYDAKIIRMGLSLRASCFVPRLALRRYPGIKDKVPRPSG